MATPITGDPTCNWYSAHEQTLINLMEDEYDSGRIGTNNSFTPKQYNEFSLKLLEQTGRFFTKEQVKQKCQRMKARTTIFQKLISTTRFGWNSETNTVTAEDDVWVTYLRVQHSFLP